MTVYPTRHKIGEQNLRTSQAIFRIFKEILNICCVAVPLSSSKLLSWGLVTRGGSGAAIDHGKLSRSHYTRISAAARPAAAAGAASTAARGPPPTAPPRPGAQCTPPQPTGRLVMELGNDILVTLIMKCRLRIDTITM